MDTCPWTRGRPIGRGTSAAVYEATDLRTGNIFAVKSAELPRSRLLQKEKGILSRLDCPRVVKYLGHDVTAENGRVLYNLFMEYADRGSLYDLIQRRGGRLREAEIPSITREVLEGLVYLHSQGVVHGDIKVKNVLLRSDGAKIADFGCAGWVHPVSGIVQVASAGTPLFRAPEVARGEPPRFPADVWALGCMVIQMAGFAPWPEMADPVSTMNQIWYCVEVPEFPSWLSVAAKDFLSKCLTTRPEERLTADQLLTHPFLDESNSWSQMIPLPSGHYGYQ